MELDLHAYMAAILKNFDSPAIQIGGYFDHVHILFSLSKKFALIKIVEEVKRSSSKWIKLKGDEYRQFYWQDGYAAFSIGKASEPALIDYIVNQHRHHAAQSFEDELRGFLRQNNMEYDERYVWA